MTFAHKVLLAIAALLIAGGAAFPDDVAGFYRGGYPSDPMKREALRLCQEVNPSFVRFLASDREACYAQVMKAARI
jgi:hypothetical protein